MAFVLYFCEDGSYNIVQLLLLLALNTPDLVSAQTQYCTREWKCCTWAHARRGSPASHNWNFKKRTLYVVLSFHNPLQAKECLSCNSLESLAEQVSNHCFSLPLCFLSSYSPIPFLCGFSLKRSSNTATSLGACCGVRSLCGITLVSGSLFHCLYMFEIKCGWRVTTVTRGNGRFDAILNFCIDTFCAPFQPQCTP